MICTNQTCQHLTFYPFPRLPIELRRAIWKYALPKPLVIFLEADDVPEEQTLRLRLLHLQTPFRGGTIPDLQGTNKSLRRKLPVSSSRTHSQHLKLL
jgi:hypothetical protein